MLLSAISKSLFLNDALGNASLLTGEVTKVIKLSATYFTVLVNGDGLDKRRIHWENTLNTYVTRHLANRKALLILRAADLDYITTELLNTLFVTLFNAVSYGYSVT